MRLSIVLFATALFLSLSACGAGTPGDPIPSDSLELTYVSGHLGIYADCPNEAPAKADADFSSAEAGMMAPCPPDDEECMQGAFMNCESAEVTIRIRNIGNETLHGVDIAELTLLASDKSMLNSLSIETIHAPAELEDGLEPGEEVLVRVEFKGPSSNWEMITHPVKVLVIDSQNNGAELVTPPLDSLPVMMS